MPQYRVIFTGRKVGAIGIFYSVTLDVEADSPESGLLACYETHEHIHNPAIYDRPTGAHCPLAGQTPQPSLKDWKS